ncbi:MAG TPA: hypothetical protein VG649_06690 [Candidatus Angelobacter sp.]|jgi:hypothetical protein|nr:hypothetical protein [Candidatus Angelobacter sp.]
MTDSEILTLVERLERCLFSPSEFHHQDHLAVAVTYLYASDFEAAMEKLRTTLARFIAHHGASGYNETLTRFWLIQIEKHIDRTVCLQESVRRVKAALGRKEMIYEFYSREKLNSPQAKQEWVEPDLKSSL